MNKVSAGGRFGPLPYAVMIAVIVLVLMRGVFFVPGAFALGDYVTPGSDYAFSVLSAWDGLEHAGEPTALNLAQIPALLTGSFIGRLIGMATYDKVCFGASLFIACAGMMLLSRRVAPRLGFLAALFLGVFYAFNPWTVSHVASGHFALFWAYALTPLLLLISFLPGRLPLFLGSLAIALIAANDFHVAELSVFSFIVFSFCVRGLNRQTGVSVGITVVGGLALSLWWLLPVLTTPGAHLPVQQTSAEGVMGQYDSLLNVLMLRSYWWSDFSQTLYTFNSLALNGGIAIACLVPSLFAAALAVAFVKRNPRGPAAVFFWIGALVVVIACSSHYAPALYALILRLPLMAPFRDPNKLLPLLILAISFALAVYIPELSTRTRRVIVCALGFALLVATIPWWENGNLRGRFTPMPFPSADFRDAMSWLNGHAAGTNTLWIPMGPYVAYSWYPNGAQDPVRFYSQSPTLNPYYDPSYDFSPGTSTYLEYLESGIRGRSFPYLGAALAPYNVRYVVLRTDAWPLPPPKPLTTPDLSFARDLNIVKRFGSIWIYENRLWRGDATLRSSHATYAPPSLEWELGSLSLDLGGAYMVASPSDPHDNEVNDGGEMITRLTENLMARFAEPTGANAADVPTAGGGGYLVVELKGYVTAVTVKDRATGKILLPVDGDFDQAHIHRVVYWIPQGTAQVSISTPPDGVSRTAFVASDEFLRETDGQIAALRGGWTEYFFPYDELFPRFKRGALLKSNFVGPLVIDGRVRWKAELRGQHLSQTALSLETTSGEKAWSLTCNAGRTSCSTVFSVQNVRAEARIALAYAGQPNVLVLHPNSPAPWAKDASLRSSAHVIHYIGTEQSFNPGWLAHCPGGSVVPASLYNYWLLGFQVPEEGCRVTYAPEKYFMIGRLVSLLTFIALIAALVLEYRPVRMVHEDRVRI